MAWHHEIKTVPEGIPKGKGSDEAMVEARRETERLRRARRRDRQRANRRRPGKPVRVGAEKPGIRGELLAGLERRLAFVEKLTFRQEVFLTGGEVVAGTYGASPATTWGALQQCAATQASQSSSLDCIMVILGEMAPRVKRGVQASESAQERIAVVEGQLGDLRQGQEGAVDAAGRLDAAEREIQELRESLMETLEKRVRSLAEETADMGKEWSRAMERAMSDACEKSVRVGESVGELVEDRLESWEDRLEDLREVVQTLVDDGERIGNRVSAHGGLLSRMR